MTRLISIAFGIVILLLSITAFLQPATARPVKAWYYDDLFKSADLVVIASATSTKDEGNTHGPEVAQVTSFDIKSVLKGETDDKTLLLWHYRLQGAATQEIDGQGSVKFRTKPPVYGEGGREIQVDQPEYLLFLKCGEDGKYFEPVSGKYDPDFSVREIYRRPLPESLLKEGKSRSRG